MIQVSVNNELFSITEDQFLSDALVQWNYDDAKIAVAINGEFVPRSTYSEQRLKYGDKIDIVKPVGGG